MKIYDNNRQEISRTLDSSPKASRQAPIDVILQKYSKSIQRDAIPEEDELLQGKFETTQRENIEDEPIQQKTENNTGLPDSLKSGVESTSGISMDDVRVHYNSAKPAQMQAHAYTQGTDIHVASGQEKHLAHEAWHVVQQMQGRVQPTTQLQGVNVNDDSSLEKEADVMGERSKNFIQFKKNLFSGKNQHFPKVIQRSVDDVKRFASEMRNDPSSKELYLYSHIKADGLGDAGQLRFLRSTLEPLKDDYSIGKIITLSTYDPETKSSLETLKSLSKSDHINWHASASGSRQKVQPTNVEWEIEYPVPDPAFSGSKNLLKVKEMGLLPPLGTEKTGEKNGGIGYGIPDISSRFNLDNLWALLAEAGEFPKTKEQVITVLGKRNITIEDNNDGWFKAWLFSKFRNFEKVEDFFNKLPGAWLVSVKNYAYSDKSPGAHPISDEQIKKNARGKTTLLIILGEEEYPPRKEDDLLTCKLKLPNTVLEFLMTKITNGVIISGGEGLFAESMGTNEDNRTATIISARYQFQYEEIAHSLLPQTHNTTKVNDFDELKGFFDAFGIIKVGDEYITCNSNSTKCFNVLTGNDCKFTPNFNILAPATWGFPS